MDEAHRAYYAARAREYDDWWLGRGLFAARDRPGWPEEVHELERLLAALPPARTLDAACGTGFLTRHLRGLVVGLDQSPEMCALAQRRLRDGVVVVGDALELPFPDRAFDRVVAGHFYGHLLGDQRERFLAEARRVGDELVVIDSARREGIEDEQWQERKLNDGSRHRVYKRFFRGQALVAEVGGGEVLHDGAWFVVVRS
ncbi:MAG TPA: methyltransferase domain-containing protein [Solirubrobacteraceae bacterium]|jgi:demethylmenaquinone methyltransferase/2-methoxy-6-polyprenyl-1,4-benzoquinol methylase